MRPNPRVSDEDVGRARIQREIVVAITVYSRRVTILVVCPDNHRVTRDGYYAAKLVMRPGIRRLEVGLLRPGGPAADENVRRAEIGGAVVTLVAVHDRFAAVFVGRPDHNRVA